MTDVCVLLCLIKSCLTLLLFAFCQWMASGSRGLCGQAVLKPVEGGASRETGFVMGPFLEGSPVLENEKRSGVVMKRDAQVSGSNMVRWAAFFCTFCLYPNCNQFSMIAYMLIPCMMLIDSPFVNRTSWNMWRGQLLQCCMEDDSSWGYCRSTLSSQCHGWAHTWPSGRRVCPLVVLGVGLETHCGDIYSCDLTQGLSCAAVPWTKRASPTGRIPPIWNAFPMTIAVYKLWWASRSFFFYTLGSLKAK